ncbi:hypothetical protein ACOME3_001534 [Neoechinorhynchus agilis]
MRIAKFYTQVRKNLRQSLEAFYDDVASFVYKASKLTHRAVIPIVGICTMNEFIAIISKEVNGYNLLDYINIHRGTIDSKKKIEWILELIDAMVYLNQKGYSHGSLKPSNVLIDKSRQNLCITNHIVRSLNTALNEPITLCQTAENIQWICPECIDQRKCSIKPEKVDVYAIGLIAWYLINEDYPIGDVLDLEYTRELIKSEGHLATFLNDADFLPLEVTTTIGECLRFDPDTRLTLQDLQKRFKQIQKNHGAKKYTIRNRYHISIKHYDNTSLTY